MSDPPQVARGRAIIPANKVRLLASCPSLSDICSPTNLLPSPPAVHSWVSTPHHHHPLLRQRHTELEPTIVGKAAACPPSLPAHNLLTVPNT